MKLGIYLAIFAATASAMQVGTEVDTETEFFLPAWTRKPGRDVGSYRTRNRRDRRREVSDDSSSESEEETSFISPGERFKKFKKNATPIEKSEKPPP